MRGIYHSDLKKGNRLIPSNNLDDESRNYDPDDWIIERVEDGKVYYQGGGYDTVKDALKYRRI